MPGEAVGELRDVRGLEAVVQLFAHACPEFVDQPLRVEALEHHRREHRIHDLGGVEVALDGLVHARVLHLDRDVTTVAGGGAVDLADRRRRHREIAPIEEDPLGRLAEIALHDARREGRRHRGGISLQRGQRVLRFVRQRLEDERDQLAGLHQDALHLAELLGHVLRRADRELLVQFGSALLRRAETLHPGDGEPCAVAD